MKVVLIQLPVPYYNMGRQTGNIPLAAACLKLAVETVPGVEVVIIPESIASYAGDAALLDVILSQEPDIVGFTVFMWNVRRSLHLARELKSRRQLRIVFGGPEVTPDNELLRDAALDFRVFGEGEVLFKELLEHEEAWSLGSGSQSAEHIFLASPSPYLTGWLEPQIEDMVIIETQRGCPFTCGYCYYNKSRKNVSLLAQEKVCDAIRYAQDKAISEVFLLDPSLDTRPDLDSLLAKISSMTGGGPPYFQSELRAEAITEKRAGLLATAGFTEVEIGLQTTNTRALKLMRRPTNLKKFTSGIERLQLHGIVAKIDLILGLPGDDLEGFKNSVDFLVDHRFNDDLQVFPLSLLPGTEFRAQAAALGLDFQDLPPYSVTGTSTFSTEEMLEGFSYAEERFSIILQPDPDCDLSYRQTTAVDPVTPNRWPIDLPDRSRLITKVVISDTIGDIERISRRLSHPYQVFILPEGWKNQNYLFHCLDRFSADNPQTPLEIIFVDPPELPDVDRIERALKLERPHFLDLDIPFWGSRAVLFTLVTPDLTPRFGGIMKRQVWLWRKGLPTLSEIHACDHLQGILIDSSNSPEDVESWQETIAPSAEELPLISFAGCEQQRQWIQRTCSGEYWFPEN